MRSIITKLLSFEAYGKRSVTIQSPAKYNQPQNYLHSYEYVNFSKTFDFILSLTQKIRLMTPKILMLTVFLHFTFAVDCIFTKSSCTSLADNQISQRRERLQNKHVKGTSWPHFSKQFQKLQKPAVFRFTFLIQQQQ